MKYTRYDFRKKKDDRMVVLIMIVSMLLAAVVIATILSSIFFKNGTGDAAKGNDSNKNNAELGRYTFVVLQGGLFQVKDYASALKTKLSDDNNPFIVEDNGKYRVLVGIYKKEDADKVSQNLSSKQLTPSKMTFNINVKDDSVKMMGEIIDAHVKIINAMKPKGQISYVTDDLKNWSNTKLVLNDKSLKDYDMVQEEKKYIASMPKEINKDNLEDYLKHIFSILSKIGEKA
ncbi:SPOR domain-containing protein [Clostridium sp. 19966]|uniref:SPOR domain-containing protein n=1 Tax=Clostridium sp. 19966 TaxID=2768166 RepID=UPI0028DE9415|nr:SPOR domain-containing protein [Clostridium sp. 19966]MDT8715266.1 SPOR domain-containing protein [Clostridium sp. 19966]